MTTMKGYSLAYGLMQFGDYGTTQGIADTCSLISRHAATYARIAEDLCNVDYSDRPGMQDRVEAKADWCEARITRLVEDLPAFDDGRVWTVQFDGDPRGWVVRLRHPDADEYGTRRIVGVS